MCKYLLLVCLLVSNVHAQTISNGLVTIGAQKHYYSKVLKEDQTYWISLPLNYDNPKFAKTRYPVIYVLDGDANFATVSSMVQQLSVRNGNSIIPESIVIGIMNNHRSRDFTPYKSSFWLYDTPPPFENAGGGTKFSGYIVNELVPTIDTTYRTAPYRVLISHSLGGLEASNILINYKKMFNGYVLIDPSMWFDNQSFLNHALSILRNESFEGVSLYLGVANNLPPQMDTLQLQNDTARKNLHMRSIFRFKNELLAIHQNKLRFRYRYYEEDTHMSVPLIAEYDGLRFLFDFYRLPGSLESTFFDPKDPGDPAEAITTHFKTVSIKLGYQQLPPESLVNLFGNTLQNYYLPQKALRLYLLNTQNYPHSDGAWESLGDCFAQQKKNSEALLAYRQALKIKDSDKVENKIKKIEETR